MRMHSFPARLAVAATLLIASCDPNDGPRNVVGPAGGFVRGEGVGLDVPPGALGSDVEIVIETVAVPAGYRAVGGNAFRFHPEGIRFDVPVTVRFAVGASEHDATVFWSRADAPSTVAATATRVERTEVVASVDHFSIGFAGWALDDAGTDGGGGDSGDTDAGESDAGTVDGGASDAAPADSGPDGGPIEITGVTCIVQERDGACVPVADPPMTYTDVPFRFVEGPSGIVHALNSPLAAFRRFYNTSDWPSFFAADAEGTQYLVGSEGPPNITRSGLVLTVDIDIRRYGAPCPDPVPPLIAIRCTGTTLVPAPSCWTYDSSLAGPLTCTVRSRDHTCTESISTDTPRFWVTAGASGPESVLRTDSPAFFATFGWDVEFYQETPCNSYVAHVGLAENYESRFHRSGDELFVESIAGRSAATCNDAFGNPQPLVDLRCGGRTTLVAAP